MKKLFIILLLLTGIFGSIQVNATEVVNKSPLWMRYPKISPDGKQIAFAYKGNIYVVNSQGGEARQLTTGDSFESQPIWSNDGKTIAFVSNRFGGMDIFTVPVTGGQATRITTHSSTETPLAFSPNDKEIYFSSSIQDPASSTLWATWMQELYRVSVKGGRPYQVAASPICSISFDKDGKSFLYYDRTGSENIWRKHHVSSVARNIFYYNDADGSHTQITTNPGEDRDPIFISDDKMVFLSERNGGSFNIYQAPVKDAENATALTSFKNHPVRFLSRANNGTLCFGYKGEIYTLTPGGKSAKVNISLINDQIEKPEYLRMNSVRDFGMSEDGKEIVIGSRGEIFATTDKYATTKQITHTPAAESGITVSPDGKTIVYASERTGTWNLYKATKAREEELHFANATLINEEPLFKEDKIERTNPEFSPDGKQIAFIENRRILKVLNLETNKVTTITDGTQHYGNSYNGFDYQWSPDGKWFTLTLTTNRHDPYSDIGIVSATEGGKIHNVTNSAYIDRSPRWVMNGNAVIFVSDRLGMRSHASWGSQNDIFIAFMNQESYDKFRMSEEEFALFKEEEKAAKEKEEKAKKEAGKNEKPNSKATATGKNADKKSATDKKEDENKKPVEIDFDGIEERTIRLTPMSSSLASAALTSDGENLYFLSAFEKGFDLWKLNTRTREVSLLKKMNTSYASLVFDKGEKNLFILGSRPSIMALAGNQVKPLSFNINMELERAGEREYMFNHVFKQQEKMFYNSNYHGVDLAQLKKEYQPFLVHINNNYDFSEMLSEILGELNVSHTGSGYTGIPTEKPTPELGLLFDLNHTADGLKVEEVFKYGPFGNTRSKVKKGSILEKIDGETIKAGEDYFPMINGKQGKAVLFGFYNPQTKERWEEVAKPISRRQQNDLIYKKWIETREAEVERLSGGRLGYVHIRSMDDGSYRDIYSEILGKYNLKDGIVIDTRYNGGGRLHEDIEILFSGKKYLEQVIRGTVSCDMPSRRYNKQSIMIVCEANYSNAHGTPWVYKHKQMGSIVGMPVPGTMTSVNWETLQDPSMHFGIPVIGYRTREGQYLENSQLEPDFLVRNKVEEAVKGRDEQLEVAVRELLKQIDANPDRW